MTPAQTTIIRGMLAAKRHAAAACLDDAQLSADESAQSLENARRKIAEFTAHIEAIDAALAELGAEPEAPPCATGMVLDGQPRTYPDDDWTHGCGRYGR